MREIVKDREELSRVSTECTEEIEEKENLWETLIDMTEERDNCLGLAACQIGVPVRAFYLHLRNEDPIRIRNPEVLELSKETTLFKNEGCMSLPGLFMDTVRHAWIKIKDDINGTKTYSGLLGVCMQHEIDHLNGVLMFDRKAPSTYIREGTKTRRNDKCTCGSGKKYKKCCGK